MTKFLPHTRIFQPTAAFWLSVLTRHHQTSYAHNEIITRKAANANVLSCSSEQKRIGPKESGLFGQKVQRKERFREENTERVESPKMQRENLASRALNFSNTSRPD